jgi:TldD protein
MKLKKMNLKNIILSCFLLISLVFVNDAKAEDNQIIRAMHDEINRSIKSLKIDNLEIPYYIEYRINIKQSYNVGATMGALTQSDCDKTAKLTVNLRVGNYTLDNSNFLDFSAFFFGSDDDEETFVSRTIPLDLDYASLRRELWLSTDAAYKQSVEVFSKKIASMKNKVRKDTTPDFTEMQPTKNYDTFLIPSVNIKEFEKLATGLSSIFKKYSEVQASTVNIEYVPETTYYVNSEGTEYVKTNFNSGIEVAGFTQATDGMPLANFYSAYSLTPDKLPKIDSLEKAIKEIADKICTLRNVKTLEESYSGPILFTNQAAGEIFAQIFAPQLSAQRDLYTEQGKQTNDRISMFQNKIGGRVLPEFLSVSDNPSLKEYKGISSFANYNTDDQGIKAQDVDLVVNGYLKALLSSRTPTKRVKVSNGHFRNGGASISNIIMNCDDEHSKSYQELKKKLIDLCKDRELPYGIIIKRIMNSNVFMTTFAQLNTTGLFTPRFNKVMPVIEAYKVYPDGREELVRGTEINNLTAQSFKDIIFVGKDKNVLNYFSSSVGGLLNYGGSQFQTATAIIPDLLFEDAEIKLNEEDLPKLPLYASPLN